jgi:adenylate cyclase
MSLSQEADQFVARTLLSAGILDDERIEAARRYATSRTTSLTDAVLGLEQLQEVELLRVFGDMYETRFVRSSSLRTLHVDEEALTHLAVSDADRLSVFPARFDAVTGELSVVASLPLAKQLLSDLRRLSGVHHVRILVATPASIEALIRKFYFQDADAFAAVTDNGAHLWAGAPALESENSLGTAGELISESSTQTDIRQMLDLAKGLSLTPPPIPLEAEVPGSAESLVRAAETNTVRVSAETLTIAQLKRENARFRVAQEFHLRLSLERSPAMMMSRILSVVFELLDAQFAAIRLVSGDRAAASKLANGEVWEEQLEMPKAVYELVIQTRKGVLSVNAATDERFATSETLAARKVRSVMAVPLMYRAELIGVFYVDAPHSASFTDDDLPLLESIASQAAMLLSNAMLVAQVQHEVEIRTSLSRFLPPAAVEEVLAGGMQVDLAGHQAETTVLFVDIRHFAELSMALPATEVVRLLNQFFDEACSAIERHGGIVDKFVGDCVMGVWGAVRPRADDARNAIRAALEMAEKSANIHSNGTPLKVGIGVHSGRAVVGAVGSRRRLDYTVIGAPVNLASRLCNIALPGEVLVTSDTLSRAGPGVAASAGLAVELRGFSQPVVPYTVTAIETPLPLTQLAPVTATP